MVLRFRRPTSLWGWTVYALVGMVLLILVGNEIAGFVLSRRLESRLAGIRAAGMPTSFAEIPDPPIPDESNAWIPYLAASRIADRVINETMGLPGVGNGGAAANSKSAAVVAAKADADPDYERNLHLADSLPVARCNAPLVEPDAREMERNANSHRNRLRVEGMRAVHLRSIGRPDDAVALLLRQIRLANKCAFAEPFAMAAMVGLSTRYIPLYEFNYILRNHRLKPETHDAIESHLAEEGPFDAARVRAVTTQRVLDLHIHEYGPLQYMHHRMLRTWEASDQLRTLDFSIHVQSVLQKPFFELKRLEGVWGSQDLSYRKLVMPGTAEVVQTTIAILKALERHRAYVRCLRVVNAAARIPGKITSLDQLKLPKLATTDPFTGEPLRFLYEPEGLVVYSVDEDLGDNGGAINARILPRDVGFGPDVATSTTGSAPTKK